MKTNVLFTWKTKDSTREYFREKLREFPKLNLIFPDDTSPESMLKFAPETDIVIGWKVPDGFLEKAERLALYNTTGTGAQHLIGPFRELNKTRKVVLCNSHGNSYAVAQHVVAMLLALTNKIIPYHQWMIDGKWRPDDDNLHSIPFLRRKIGFLGYGAINQDAHRFLAGFDLEFHALKRDWSSMPSDIPTPIEKYDHAAMRRFLRAIDTLIIAIPLTSYTKGMIGQEELALLGPDGLLVNVARGGVVDEESLYQALKNKTIAGAAIDVWYNYHPEPDAKGRLYPTRFPFHELDNIVLSPHRAASPFDSLEMLDDVIENIRRYASGRDDFINVMSLEHEY